MKINEIITEAFDKPYAFNWSRGDHGDYDVFVKLPDGSPLNIAFNREGDDGWHVAFDRGHSQEITGEGDAQRIFATVLTSIQQFILKENPDRLYFSASKDVEPGQNPTSRARLYERMVRRYANSLGYDVVVDDGRGHTMFVLDKDQSIAEDSNDGKPLWHINSYDNFETAFEIDLVIDGKDIGFFSYQYDPEQDTVENDIRIINDSERGRGYGKLLLLKAIETAQQHNLPYKRDHRGTSPAQSRVYSSLINDGIIKVEYDKTITLTGKNLSTTKEKNPRFSLIAQGQYVGHFDDHEDAKREADRIANDPNSKYQMVMVKDNSSKEIVYEVWKNEDVAEDSFDGIDKHRSKQNVWEGQIVETQFAVNRNPAKGLWQLRMPKAGAPLVDETEFVVLKDARPWQAPEGKEKLKITNFVVGDETDEKPQGEGRQIGYIRGGDDPFVYMDTMQPYRGSRYVVFNDRKFLAFDSLEENFADGKVKGKSRPGRVKRAGASCNGSVTDLRARAKNASGEKAKMYHWCANMKSGRKK